MMKRTTMFALTAISCMTVCAQVKIKGVLENNRYDDGDEMRSEWIGSLYDENGKYTGKTAFIVDNGIYAMNWNGTTLSTPKKEPAVNIADIKQGSQVDYDKAVWATNFNLMAGNSGAVYVDGTITTVFSRDYQSTEDDELFAVRKWNATTGDLLSGPSDFYPVSMHLESAGMSYNPVDGKVYGLFYLTAQQLGDDITSDPGYFVDEDDEASGTDAGYAICTIDLKTLAVTPITPGLYYKNFVTFAINSEGRAFALTSGGSNGYVDDDGKLKNMDGVTAGAELCEFDLKTGLMKTYTVEHYAGTDSAYVSQENIYKQGMGYASQYRRQSACFAKSNPYKMYWNGYYNSGKGINDWGSWSSLSDKEWRTNGKFDTCLYEVDILTGTCKRLAKIDNRCIFSCMWVDGDDNSDGAGEYAGIGSVAAKTTTGTATTQTYNLAGQRITGSKGAQRGLSIVKNGNTVKKVMNK